MLAILYKLYSPLNLTSHSLNNFWNDYTNCVRQLVFLKHFQNIFQSFLKHIFIKMFNHNPFSLRKQNWKFSYNCLTPNHLYFQLAPTTEDQLVACNVGCKKKKGGANATCLCIIKPHLQHISSLLVLLLSKGHLKSEYVLMFALSFN